MSHISVMIPVYNHARFIGQTIESVLNQHHQDIGVLVVDDASTDDTPEVVSSYYSDARLQYVRNEENLGIARNWNRCLDLAEGPLVMVFGSDDLLDSGYLAEVNRIFEQYPEVGLVYGPVRTIDAKNKIINEGTAQASGRYDAGDEAVTLLLTEGICTVTTVMRRSCYEHLGNYNEEIRDGPDVELSVRIASQYDIYNVGQIHGSVRVHDQKMGHLSYMRQDRLDSYMYGNKLIWNYLSSAGLRNLGIKDLDKYIALDGVQFALNGSMVMIGYGRPDMVRYYLRRVISLDNRWWQYRRFWQTLLLLILPSLGRQIVRRRMRID